jgi:cell division protein FtsW (lipid II flippase)
MSLPFISYGGSNLMTMFILLGVFINIFRTWNKPAITEPREL